MNSPHLSKNNGSTRDPRLHNNNIHTKITNLLAWLIILFKFNQYYSIPIPSLSVKVPQFWHSRSTIVVVISSYCVTWARWCGYVMPKLLILVAINLSLYWDSSVGKVVLYPSPTIIHTQEMHGCLGDQLFSKVQLCFFTIINIYTDEIISCFASHIGTSIVVCCQTCVNCIFAKGIIFPTPSSSDTWHDTPQQMQQ